ncbi:hypothetical protein I5G72_gp02 [Mycobacterium phage Collard]|uniref:Uncharacterized protein n=1 Tax=Mycobacterium phage Collard TaxID=2301704 RepID=A0A385DUP6_9CAUD|nr:hypothetical protein I5G72_gp02 [Mycobacterium phage Collard]AXQ63186.1 hypothetical protein SEA_COLLARD_2 [Mycobacterium phage Collard]
MIGIVASTLDRAERLARELNVGRPVPMSVRSILQGHGRGLVLDTVLVDESALPLLDEVRATLAPCLYARGGRVHELRRVEL